MRITLLGTGTSQGVPTIGCDCDVCISTDPHDKRLRTSALIEGNETRMVIDTGPDFRTQMLRTGVSELDAVLFTHEHRDHIAGLDDIRPFYFRRGSAMPIYATQRVLDDLRACYSYAFAENKYPGAPDFDVHLIDRAPFEVGEFEVQPLFAYHGKLPVRGFRVGNMAYLTDVNRIPATSKAHLQDLDVLVLDALRMTSHHSHFSLDEALALVEELQPRQTYFIHISHLMGLHEEVNADLPPNAQLGFDGQIIEF